MCSTIYALFLVIIYSFYALRLYGLLKNLSFIMLYKAVILNVFIDFKKHKMLPGSFKLTKCSNTT